MSCQGINSKGEPCGLPAGWGTDNENYCRYHEDQGGIVTLKLDMTKLTDPYLLYETDFEQAIYVSLPDISYADIQELEETVTSGRVSGEELTLPQ